MKQALTVLLLIVAAAAVMFWKQVLGVFAGMSVLEAMEFIVTFVLHVTVGTVAAYVAFGLPEIVKPWVRMFKQKRRAQRRGRSVVNVSAPVEKAKRISAMQLLQMLAPEKAIKREPTQAKSNDSTIQF